MHRRRHNLPWKLRQRSGKEVRKRPAAVGVRPLRQGLRRPVRLQGPPQDLRHPRPLLRLRPRLLPVRTPPPLLLLKPT
uniref:Uncharacterized protein n=1 Tax=Oryza barthii TaxID=65489 RepID=A0A0D3FFY8_9ORYZ